jgi:hypothetical protein
MDDDPHVQALRDALRADHEAWIAEVQQWGAKDAEAAGDTERMRRHLAHVARLRAVPYPWEKGHTRLDRSALATYPARYEGKGHGERFQVLDFDVRRIPTGMVAASTAVLAEAAVNLALRRTVHTSRVRPTSGWPTSASDNADRSAVLSYPSAMMRPAFQEGGD